MDIKDFLCQLVLKINDESFELLKRRIVGEYLSFAYYDDESIDRIVFAEKLYDYFEKVELKTGKVEILSSYIENLDSIVGKRIKKTPPTKKGEAPLPIPRARKYYEYACEIRKTRQYTLKQIEDYSRIMLCLYMQSIISNGKEIDDFDYSLECLELDKIISAMKEEKPVGPIPFGYKLKFDTKELYSYDTCTFVVTMLIFCHIKSNKVEGEY